MKRLLIIAVLLGALGVAGGYAAELCVDTTVSSAIGWQCELGDKLFSFLGASENIGNLAILNFTMNETVFPHEHSINVFNFPSGWGPGTYWLEYTVQVIAAGVSIIGARLDVNTNSATMVATKELTFGAGGGLTLTSVGGMPDTQWFAPVPFITVLDTWTVPAGYTAWGVSDTFYQSIPEPMTLSLIGAGLLAIGLLRRRKK